MMALNALEFPETQDPTAMVRFVLRICKDGSVQPELVDGAPVTPLEDEALALLRGVKVPPLPPHVEAAMRSSCAKLKYTFHWTLRGIR